MPIGDWNVRLTEAAEADFIDILRWTNWRFGDGQAHDYGRTLRHAITSLAGWPTVPGARPRPEIADGYFTLHVARGGRKGRHFLLFTTIETEHPRRIELLRILHDAMDLRRHLP